MPRQLQLHNTHGQVMPLRYGLVWGVNCAAAFADDGFGNYVETDMAIVCQASRCDLLETSCGSFHQPTAPAPVPSLL